MKGGDRDVEQLVGSVLTQSGATLTVHTTRLSSAVTLKRAGERIDRLDADRARGLRDLLDRAVER